MCRKRYDNDIYERVNGHDFSHYSTTCGDWYNWLDMTRNIRNKKDYQVIVFVCIVHTDGFDERDFSSSLL